MNERTSADHPRRTFSEKERQKVFKPLQTSQNTVRKEHLHNLKVAQKEIEEIFRILGIPS